ncbi:hypothetical protein D3C87_2050000 [compost metagenome]
MQMNKTFDDRKPEAGTAALAILGLCLEAVEHGFQHVRRNAGAAIAHREEHVRRIAPAIERDRRVLRREIRRIGQKLDQDLF